MTILKPMEKSWEVLKRFRGQDERRQASRGGNMARLIDPKKPDLGYKDKPGGPEGKPFFEIPDEKPRDVKGGQGNLPHKWHPRENPHIVDLSDYPTPESHQAHKLLEKILAGRMVKKVTENKERGTKDTKWIDRRDQGDHSKSNFGGDENKSRVHQHGLSHDNAEVLGRQALKHLHDLGLDAARVRGHIFINIPNVGRGDSKSPVYGAETDSHTFYMPVSSEQIMPTDSNATPWPHTIHDKYNMDVGSDPHTLLAQRWSLHSTGRRAHGPMNVQGKDGKTRAMYQNHFIDDMNLINPYHSNNILVDAESHKNPEASAKRAFEADYWKRRDAEQKGWQEEGMNWEGGLPRITGKAPPPLPGGMLTRMQNELRAMQRWWEDPSLKAKDIKEKMPYFWNFANIQWSEQAHKMPKKWWKKRANEMQQNLAQMAAREPKVVPPKTPMVTGRPMDDFDPSKWRAADPSDWTPPDRPEKRERGFRPPTGERTPGTVLGRFGVGGSTETNPTWDKKKDPPRDEKGKPLPGSEFEGWDAEGNIIWRANPLETAFDIIIKFAPGPLTGGADLAPIREPLGPSAPPGQNVQNPDAGNVRCDGCSNPFPISDLLSYDTNKQGEGAQFDAFRAIPQGQRLCRSCRQLTSQGEQGMLNWGPGIDANKERGSEHIYVSEDRPRYTGLVMVQ